MPVLRNQRLCGGLVVAGVNLGCPSRAGSLDRQILAACQHLLDLATNHDLTNAALLAVRRQSALRERDKAEAIHQLKVQLHDDIRSTYPIYRPNSPTESREEPSRGYTTQPPPRASCRQATGETPVFR